MDFFKETHGQTSLLLAGSLKQSPSRKAHAACRALGLHFHKGRRVRGAWDLCKAHASVSICTSSAIRPHHQRFRVGWLLTDRAENGSRGRKDVN